jgi:hypothetical protein
MDQTVSLVHTGGRVTYSLSFPPDAPAHVCYDAPEAGTILSVIVSVLLSIAFVCGVWQSDFCAAAHPLFLWPFVFCQHFILVWLCLLPCLLGLPLAQVDA